ncbi:MAG TPA: hypothetical protein VJQ09_07510 [Candidatus Limnocylindria bacterium]|nr:hypothetical protein [Candidatus Limnocylindria bacterium]
MRVVLPNDAIAHLTETIVRDLQPGATPSTDEPNGTVRYHATIGFLDSHLIDRARQD